MLDGLSVGAAFNGGGVSGNAYDVCQCTGNADHDFRRIGEAETGGPC